MSYNELSDKVVGEAKEPEKKSDENPKRNETQYEQCMYCQDMIPLGSKCPRCGVSRQEFDTRFSKFVRSD